MHADFHETPPEAINALADLEPVFFNGPVWDPAAGHGAITRQFRARGQKTLATDLNAWPARDADVMPQVDFLALDKRPPGVPERIVTNPPFNLHLQFLRKSLAFAAHVAFLLPATYIAGQRRKKLFDVIPPNRVWVFSRRLPMMHRVGYEGPKADSQMDVAWFIWDADRLPPGSLSALGWVDWEDFTPSG